MRVASMTIQFTGLGLAIPTADTIVNLRDLTEAERLVYESALPPSKGKDEETGAQEDSREKREIHGEPTSETETSTTTKV